MYGFDYAPNTYSIGHAERRLVGREWNDIVWDKNHFHIQYHRLYFPLSGTARLRLLNKEIELVSGRVYFIPAFSVAESLIDGVMDKFFIHFQAHSPLLEMYRYLTDRFSVPAHEHSEYLFTTVERYHNDRTYNGRLKVQGAMNLIMSDFLDGLAIDRNSLKRFEPVLDYINLHYRENISLAYLAELMNISQMYFSNYFKKVFNISPRQYILNKRLTESQRLLLETEMSVKEIAYAVGFENENYFSEYFSQKVGVSALRFRNRELPEVE